MERDIRYITVGLVVAILLASGGALILWQAADQSTGRGGQEYVIPFDGSVGGLTVGSAVRYMGMHAGNVTDVGLTPGRVDQVEVRIHLNEETPINASTVARIRPQGITGRSYVGLTTTEPTAEVGPAPRDASHDVPVLRGKPSQLERAISRLPQVMEHVEGVAANAEQLLNADNRKAVAGTLDNARKLLGPENRESVAATLDNTATLTNKATRLTEQARGTIERLDANLAAMEQTINESTHSVRAVRALLPHVKRAADNVARLSDRLDGLVATYGDDYGELGTRNLRQLRSLLRDARRTSGSIRDLVEQLSKNPSQLIFQPAEEGMEIPR